MQKSDGRTLCISVSKRNRRYSDLLDDYSLEFNMDKANTFFRILREYNTFKCLQEAEK